MEEESIGVRRCISLINSCQTHSQARSAYARINRLIELHKDRRDTGLEVFLSNLFIQAFSKCGDTASSVEVFDKLHDKRNFFSWALMLAAYAAQGNVEESKKTFDQMPLHDVLSWTVMIKACVAASHLDQAKLLFEIMPERDIVSWTVLLAAFSERGFLEQAKSVFESMPKHDLVSVTALLTAYARNRNELTAIFFNSMPEWNLTTCNVMLDWCGDLEAAKQLFDAMPVLDIVSWNCLLSSYIDAGQIQTAKLFFDRMPYRDVISWTKMLGAFAERSSSLESAVELFDLMPERDVVSWTIMLTAYARSGHLEQAESVFCCMPARNSVSWTAWLALVFESGRLDETLSLFHEMPERNSVSWNAMISAYARSGHLEQARKQLVRNPLRFVASWNSMVAAYARDGRAEDSLELLGEMELEGTLPDETSFVCLLQACSHKGNVGLSLSRLFSMIVDRGMNPSKQHLCCVIDLLGRAGRLSDVEDLLSNMPFVPDAVEWLCFLGASRSQMQCKGGSISAAESALHLEPQNPAPYSLLANLYSM